jgi:hypothetical protein
MGQSCTAWGRGILSHRQILIKAADKSVMRAADPALRLGPSVNWMPGRPMFVVEASFEAR